MKFEEIDEILKFLPKDIVQIIFDYYNTCVCDSSCSCVACYQDWAYYWTGEY